MEHERKMQALDIITVVCVLYIIGYFIGKYVADNVANTWFAYNGPAIGVLAFGELIWW